MSFSYNQFEKITKVTMEKYNIEKKTLFSFNAHIYIHTFYSLHGQQRFLRCLGLKIDIFRVSTKKIVG